MQILAQDIINSLYNPNDIVHLRIFDDKKSGTFAGTKLDVEAGKFSTIEETLTKHNQMGRGIFFVVNTGGQDDKSITRINAQFVESDELSLEEQQKQVEGFPLPPSMIIKTRKSLHVYWFVKEASVELFRTIQHQLVKQFQGDPMCVNESRVMRLPGFYHQKQEPVMVECISFHPERRYTQQQLMDVLPEVETAPQENMRGVQKGLKVVQLGCKFIKHCEENAASLSEADWYAMITNLAPFAGGDALIRELSKPYPNYSEAETQKKINHYIKSGTKPMTCKAIAEKGFKCPLYEAGTCSCKAPAAMAYQPLELDGIRKILGELTVKNSVVEDMQTARSFIEEYLFNVDSITAESVINYELKAHFNLRQNDLKPLLGLQRDLYKKFTSSADTKRFQMGMDIPDWYEPTEHGLRFMPGVLADYMSKEVSAFYAAEQYYNYEAGVYKELNELAAKNMVRSNMISKITKLSQITDTEGQWRMQVQKDARELNSNPYIINVKNGLLNVIDGTLSNHTPEYLSTVQLAVNYTPGSDCPRFLKYMHESLPDDQVKLVQEMFGYFLIPVNRAQKCFVIVGEAGAGKSVLLLVLNDILLGKQNVSNVTWQALNERFKTAELFGKLANIFADLPTKNIDDNGIFKALVGEDYLTVEKKNKNPFSFQPYARLLFSCNSIPRNYGDKSEGFYRRLVIIRFAHAVAEAKRDPDLLNKFRTESDGIFLWALEGLKRLMNNNFKFSVTETNLQELQRYREDSNSVLSFVKDCCMIEPGAEAVRTEIYNQYKTYCNNCGMNPYSQKSFNNELETAYPQLVRGTDTLGKRRTWKGLKLGEILD